MFEIIKKESSSKTIRMPNQLIAILEKLAVEKDTSFNQVVIQCCEYALKAMKEDNRPQQ